MNADAIRDVLRRHELTRLPCAGMRAAAVLVPLRLNAGALQLLLTRRTAHLSRHAGEISFPGGGVDPQDADDWAAALRETEEELGVDASRIELLGRLDDCYSIHDYRVSCYVGLLQPVQEFRLEPGEIAELIELPLAALGKPQVYHQEDLQHEGRPLPVDFYTLDGYVIWGMTGGILTQLLERLGPLLRV